jgi:hypothetical protein
MVELPFLGYIAVKTDEESAAGAAIVFVLRQAAGTLVASLRTVQRWKRKLHEKL